MDVRTTRHTIEDQVIAFTVVAPTSIGDMTTRRVEVTDLNGRTVMVKFDHDGFQLFKSILNEY